MTSRDALTAPRLPPLRRISSVQSPRGNECEDSTVTKPRPPLDPDCADEAPNADTLTPYDMGHLVTYVRLLDAEAEGADWTEVAHVVLHIDPSREPMRARRAWETHLARAKWMTEHGYRHLLRVDNDN
jgi:hypothetical protein